MEHIVLTNGLKKSFKAQGKTVEAVRGVNLAVRTGEVFGFLGPNGAGKTTTLRMLTTLLTPDAGEATLAGCDLLKHPQRLRERIGYVSQAGGSDRGMSAWENLVLQGRLFGMNRHNAAAQAKALILAFDLEAIADRKAATYSGGQRRRLDVALGMMHQPQLLFLDEPTTGLDPQNRARLWEEVRRLRDSGVTIFLTTHYLDEADALADRIAIMDQGKIEAEGSPRELKKQIAGDVVLLGLSADGAHSEKALQLFTAQPYVREASYEQGQLRLYVHEGEATLPDILRLLDHAQIGLKTISLSQPTLDDVFLRQTGRSLAEA
jgi:ABC-2 type transport system ATP-binding protein